MSLQIDGPNNAVKDIATGNELVTYAAVASAVNQVTHTNAATGSGPISGATGDDTNIDYLLSPKGTGKIRPGVGILMQDGSAPNFGHAVVLANGGTVDQNYTLIPTEYNCLTLEITGALTAQRNRVVPLTDGAVWLVYNHTTGGQSIQVIGASGTGIVVANGKRAILGADGTNIIRWTADV